MKKPNKTEIAADTALKAQTLARGVKIDRLGILNAKIIAALVALAPTEKEAQLLEFEIAGWAEPYAAELPVLFGGPLYSAVCSERKNKRTLDQAQCRIEVGDEEYFAAASVSLGDADVLATRFAGVAACIATARTGKRTVTTVAKI